MGVFKKFLGFIPRLKNLSKVYNLVLIVIMLFFIWQIITLLWPHKKAEIQIGGSSGQSDTSLNLSNKSKVSAETTLKKDITKEAKKVIRLLGKDANDSKVYGGLIDESGILHVTMVLNDMRTLGNGILFYNSPETATLFQTMPTFFLSAEKLYYVFPQVQKIKMYFVIFRSTTDNYGNDMGKKKLIIATYTLSKDKIEKINFRFVTNEIYRAIFRRDTDIFISMLDDYEIHAEGVEG
ncbi:MAG: hypothetical protein HF300_00870 [Ignavibacteria bacterium]|jgi:hypothetical protein|nr:hypothetical protein [Ignavibacteria bacterium]